MVKLSICIPTYNFGKYIAETLHSILDQQGAAEIEVIIVDGASTDNTEDIVRGLQRRYPQVKYLRLPSKGGIDRDMARSVELASGEYCWLFSSDDIMRKGAIQVMLNEIKQGYDLYLCTDMECTLDMRPRAEREVLPGRQEMVFHLASASERKRYFALALNTVALFSFMSVVVVKKSLWDSIPINEAFVGSCWAHVARLFEILATKGFSLKYLPRPYLDRRGGNDSFADRGLVNRYRIAIEGYHRLADTFFGHNSPEAFHIRRVIRKEFGLRAFFIAKFRCHETPERESKALLDTLFFETYSDPSITAFVKGMAYKYCPTPGWLFFSARRLYRRMRYETIDS